MTTIIVAAIGYGVSQSQERVYSATTSVIIGQSIQATNLDTRDIQTSERLALTYADIVRRQPILEGTIQILNLDESWQDLRKRVSVNLVPDTQLLEITVEASSREEAVAIANEINRQLVLLSPTSVNAEDDESALFVRHRLRVIQSQIETTQSKLVELSVELDEAQTPEARTEIENQINNLESMIFNWENNYTKFLQFIGGEESANYVTIVDQAYAKATPVRPNIRLNTIIAAAVGMFLGLGAIFVLDFLDDTIKTIGEIGSDLRLTPLGSISRIKKRDFQGGMIVSKNPFLPVFESYRIIRNNILSMLLYVDTPGKSIMVTSPAAGDGKSITAVNLAISMAQSGRRTIIVDADLRWPVLHDVFNVLDGARPTNPLDEPDFLVTGHLRRTDIERLYLLTVGGIPSNFSELLESERMEQFINSLKEEADVVIFDSPPAALVADATIMARHVDGVVLVVSAGKTQRDALNIAVMNLKRAGANILGVVLNRSNETNDSYYYKHAASSRRRRFSASRIVAGIKYAWKIMTLKNWRRKRRRERVESFSQGRDDKQVKYPASSLHDDDILADELSTESAPFRRQVAQQEQGAQQEEIIAEVRTTYGEDMASQAEITPQKKSNGSISKKDLASYDSEARIEVSSELQPQTITGAQPSADDVEQMAYLGNKRGSKFHRPDCHHAERIDSEQYQGFASRELAIDSGYSPCQVCKP